MQVIKSTEISSKATIHVIEADSKDEIREAIPHAFSIRKCEPWKPADRRYAVRIEGYRNDRNAR